MQGELNQIEKKMDEFIRKTERNDVSLSKDMEYLKIAVKEIKVLVGEHYVTKTEFDPIRKIVYGLVGLILTAVVTGVVSLVLK